MVLAVSVLALNAGIGSSIGISLKCGISTSLRKKGDGNRVIGKEEKRGPKRRFLDVVKEDMGEVDARETDVETGRFGET